MSKKGSKLTPKQAAFVAEYQKDWNGAAAARRAGYSEKSAHKQAPQLLAIPSIIKELESKVKAKVEKIDVQTEEILNEFKNIGFSDLLDLYNEDGTLKHPREWPVETRRAVASIETEELFDYVNGEKVWIGYTKKVKFWNKNQALEALGKHKKMFNNVVEVELGDKLAQHLAKSRQRLNDSD